MATATGVSIEAIRHMDLQLEELQGLSLGDVLRESVSVPRAAPRAFAQITLAFLFPLSFAVLAHSLFTHPLIRHLHSPSPPTASQLSLLFLYQLLYLLFLFTFSLLSTAAVVFTVSSLYAAKPVSFSATLTAIRPIFPRLFRTFLWVSLLILLYHLLFGLSVLALLVASPSRDSLFFLSFFIVVIAMFVAVHVYISALWHLASVVSVLEPVCGLPAMAKSRDLLRGRTRMALSLVAGYLGACALIGQMFRAIVIKAPDEEGSVGVTSVPEKVLVGGALVAVLVMVNLVGLLVQSVFYYVCKSYHHQQIDKSALHDHLGGYLGEYVPLKSAIQMENL